MGSSRAPGCACPHDRLRNILRYVRGLVRSQLSAGLTPTLVCVSGKQNSVSSERSHGYASVLLGGGLVTLLVHAHHLPG